MTLKNTNAKLGLVNLQGVTVIFSNMGSLYSLVVNDEQLMISLLYDYHLISLFTTVNVIYDLWLHLKILDVRLFLSSSLLQPTVCLPVSSTCSYSVAHKLWIYQYFTTQLLILH